MRKRCTGVTLGNKEQVRAIRTITKLIIMEVGRMENMNKLWNK